MQSGTRTHISGYISRFFQGWTLLSPLVAALWSCESRLTFMKHFFTTYTEHELSRCVTKARGSVSPLLPPPPHHHPPPLPLSSHRNPRCGGHLRHFHAPTPRTRDPETRLPAIRMSSPSNTSSAHRRLSDDAAERLRCAAVFSTTDSGATLLAHQSMSPTARRSFF